MKLRVFLRYLTKKNRARHLLIGNLWTLKTYHISLFTSHFLLVLCAGNIVAQPLTLENIKAGIQSSHPELKMYDAQANEFDAYAAGAKAWEAPQIGAGFFMTPYSSSYWSPQVMDVNGMQSANPGMGNFMIQVQQMIPNPGRTKANSNYMRSMSAVEKESKNTAYNQLVLDAKRNYYEWQIDKKKIATLAKAQSLLTQIVELSEKRIAYQQEKLSNVYKAKSQLARLQNEVWMLETDIKQRKYALNRLMNRDKATDFEIDTAFTIADYDMYPIDTSAVLNSRSDLKAIEKNITVARYKQKTENAKAKPDFGIQFGHMFSFGDNPNLFTLMGMVSVPIAPWSSRMYKSSSAGIKFQMDAYALQRESIINEATGMLYGLQSEIANKKRQLKLFDTTILPVLENTYKVTFLAYTQNTGDLFEVLDARMNVQMTQLQRLDMLKELLVLQAEYEKQAQIY